MPRPHRAKPTGRILALTCLALLLQACARPGGEGSEPAPAPPSGETVTLMTFNVENLFDSVRSGDRPEWLQKELKNELKGWTTTVLDKKVAQLSSIINGMNGAIQAGTVTYDFERLMEGATLVSCSGFGEAVISHM